MCRSYTSQKFSKINVGFACVGSTSQDIFASSLRPLRLCVKLFFSRKGRKVRKGRREEERTGKCR